MSETSFAAPSSFWNSRIELSSKSDLFEDELTLEDEVVPRLDDVLEELAVLEAFEELEAPELPEGL